MAAQRLNIVVPYRDREPHFLRFVPHMRAYFSRDKLDSKIPYRVLIIEQSPGLPFNRGALKNIGFLVGRDSSEYTCFHDVDYLPIWANYSFTDVPTSIAWYGAEVSLIAPGRSDRTIRHNLEHFFGGVVLCPNNLFDQVNGYSNLYWGWGFEDSDLRLRFTAADVETKRRKGSFQVMEHDNQGFTVEGGPSAIAIVNQHRFKEKWAAGGEMAGDGLSSVAYEVLNRRALPPTGPDERSVPWEIVTVRLNLRPSDEQQLAAQRKP